MPHTALITNFHKNGGGQRIYVHILARNLLKAGHRPIVACPRGSFLARDCSADGIEVLDAFRFRQRFTPVSFSRDVALARRVVAEKQIDVIHVNGSRDHWIMATANFFSEEKVPIVRTLHNTKPVRNTFLNKLLYQKSTAQTISVCHYVKEMLAESPVLKNSEMAVIHNGIEIEKFSPMPQDKRVRAELNIPPDDLVVGIVGRLAWDKGHKYLFEAVLPLIRGEFPDIKVVVVGFGKDHAKLARLCEMMGIAQHVVFTGVRNDIREVISIFDIGVQPSIGIDTSSYSMKEIMAMEKPVVCSSYGGLKEIAEDGVTGYIVPPRDSEALSKRLIDLCRSRELRERMGKAGRERVEQEFTSQVSVRRTLEVY
ncbi:MAG: glycosyltransferase family 4 protein [Candidatus Lindowbacteria bacterium]|nr:glycosyltransferase family 4 protein [Candidatus Lindowbacteria bacterium]